MTNDLFGVLKQQTAGTLVVDVFLRRCCGVSAD